MKGKETKSLDCKGLGLGRILLQTSIWLRGLDRLDWDPRNEFAGVDEVHLLNADQVKSPYQFKKYAFHSGYPGGFKRVFAWKLLQENPKLAFKRSLSGYLPKNKSNQRLLKRVKIFKSNEAGINK